RRSGSSACLTASRPSRSCTRSWRPRRHEAPGVARVLGQPRRARLRAGRLPAPTGGDRSGARPARGGRRRRVAGRARDGRRAGRLAHRRRHREADVIAGKVANALALDWPRDRLEVIVACDGSPDDTAARARAAGADRVLDLPWGGKIRAQDAGVAEARGDLLAFSDANALWEPDALRALAARFADPRVGYVCGQVRFVSAGGTNQEGLYWRYEMAIRGLES